MDKKIKFLNIDIHDCHCVTQTQSGLGQLRTSFQNNVFRSYFKPDIQAFMVDDFMDDFMGYFMDELVDG